MDMARTHNQLVAHRAVAITSCTLSIFAGLLVLIWWYLIPLWDNYRINKQIREYEAAKVSGFNQYPSAPPPPPPRRRKRMRQFRHDLTMALISIDLMRAIILIIFPTRYLHANNAGTNGKQTAFCDALGFLTVASTQSSDFAVLALAIHTALLVFCPNFTGGLFRFRYYIYVIFFFLLPLAAAGVGFVGSGYTFYTTWCFLVIHPVWYSLVLSWIPRMMIILLIFSIYLSIFIYVRVHMYHVSKALIQATPVSSNTANAKGNLPKKDSRWLKRIFSGIWRRTKIFMSYFPGLGYLNPLIDKANQSKSDKRFHRTKRPNRPYATPQETTAENSTATEASNISTLFNEDIQYQLNKENLDRFNHRRSIIERQVNSIFIYPIAYVICNLFPLIQQFMYYTRFSSDDIKRGSVVTPFWLSLIAAFSRPLNCLVDSIIFVIREGAVPCLSPKRRIQNRKNRLRALDPEFQNDDDRYSTITAPPQISPDPLSTGLPAPENSLDEDSPQNENEYYNDVDMDIDFIIRDGSIVNLSPLGLTDEETQPRNDSGILAGNELTSYQSNSSAWLHRTYKTVVEGSMNSVSHFLRSDRHAQSSQGNVTMQTLTIPEPAAIKKSSVSNQAQNARWNQFSFTGRNPADLKQSPVSPLQNPLSSFPDPVIVKDAPTPVQQDVSEKSKDSMSSSDPPHSTASADSNNSVVKTSISVPGSEAKDNQLNPKPARKSTTGLSPSNNQALIPTGYRFTHSATAPLQQIVKLQHQGKPLSALQRFNMRRKDYQRRLSFHNWNSKTLNDEAKSNHAGPSDQSQSHTATNIHYSSNINDANDNESTTSGEMDLREFLSRGPPEEQREMGFKEFLDYC